MTVEPSKIHDAVAEAMEYKARDLMAAYSDEEMRSLVAWFNSFLDRDDAEDWIQSIAVTELESRAS
jgi:hypothetical protein